MITHQHVLKLLLHHYHDGRYLNGHPEIAEWLSTSGICHVELLHDELERMTYNNVRVWSSKEEYEKRKVETIEQARTFYKRYAEPDVKVARQKHPLEIELEHLIVTASTSAEFTRLVELKGQLRKMGIHVNQSKTSLRKILKL